MEITNGNKQMYLFFAAVGSHEAVFSMDRNHWSDINHKIECYVILMFLNNAVNIDKCCGRFKTKIIYRLNMKIIHNSIS